MLREKYRAILKIGTLMLLMQACGDDGKSTSAAKLSKGSMSYSFSFNGCETGEHKFDSVGKYCEALKDQQLNRGCALEIRKEAFQKNCSGKTWIVTNIGGVPCGGVTCDGATQYCLTSYVGMAQNPPQCRPVPNGFVYEDVSSTCDLLVKDAKNFYSGVENCNQGTYCGRVKAGDYYNAGGYQLDCHANL